MACQSVPGVAALVDVTAAGALLDALLDAPCVVPHTAAVALQDTGLCLRGRH